MCNYIKFSDSTFTLPPNQQEVISGEFSVTNPPTAEIGDNYYFNIVALSDKGQWIIENSARCLLWH